MQKIWKIKEPDPRLQQELSRSLSTSTALAQLLINRGARDVKQAREFLSCDLARLDNPFLLKGMEKAVRRIKKAIAGREKIMVWGDYDIDGITSTALMISELKKMRAYASHYIPNRLEEGYGLNKTGAELAKKRKVTLIITVDCGIAAFGPISYLKEMGIDVIVCDHHQPKKKSLPAALAIINPLQEGCPYPYKYLCGVGLAFKLASALNDNQRDVFNRYADLIALGTVGDLVPLTGENRILAKHGLAAFAQTERLGLKALLEVCGLADRQINGGHIGYILGPRINASGRLGSPEDSLSLLLADTQKQAQELAQGLNRGNRLRQKIESQTLQEAIAQVESQINFKEHDVIVLAAPHWHQGVVGIVASRLAERYFRPAIMLSLDDNFGRGSGRSIGNFHLLEAIDRCKDLLEEYGGHRRACGLRLKKERFDQFFQTINRVAKEMLIPEDLIPSLEIDVEVPLADLNDRLINDLSSLAPFGIGNPLALFCSDGLKVRGRTSLIAGNHLKFWVTDGRLTCEAIGYNKAGKLPMFKGGENISLVYSPSINNWQGNLSIQLKIEDLKISSDSQLISI